MTSPSFDLACRELVELVTDYLEARLSVEDRTRFERHLGDCDGCRTYLQQMRQVLAATGKLSEEPLAPRVRDSLLAAFRTWRSGTG